MQESVNPEDDPLWDVEVEEGMALLVWPPKPEYIQDPMWFDQLGRDPLDQRKVLKLSSRDEIKTALTQILAEWPRYGPAIYNKAAKKGRVDLIEILLEKGADIDPKTMKGKQQQRDESDTEDERPRKTLRLEDREGVEEVDDDDDDDDEPGLEPEHAYLTAILQGHLDIVKLLVEKGGVPVDYRHDNDESPCAILFAANRGHVEIVRYLLEKGVLITAQRSDDSVLDLQAAVKGGKVEIVEMILERVGEDVSIQIDDLGLAAHFVGEEMVHFVLKSDCFGVIRDSDGSAAGAKEHRFTEEQTAKIEESVVNATVKGSVDSVKLLLRQLTPTLADGSLQPFQVSDFRTMQIFNATEDAIDENDMDNPELFQLLWDTILSQAEASEEAIQNRMALPQDDMLNRRLITACTNGAIGTVKLLVETYGANINHVSHKYGNTPLTLAAGSGAKPLHGRLEVMEYLLKRPGIDIDLSLGDYCNGATALALAVGEATKVPEQRRMVELLLKYGGPVDTIDDDLFMAKQTRDNVKVIVQYVDGKHRKTVALSSADGEQCARVALEYMEDEIDAVLKGIKFRKSDAALLASDPKARPLMPAPDKEAA